MVINNVKVNTNIYKELEKLIKEGKLCKFINYSDIKLKDYKDLVPDNFDYRTINSVRLSLYIRGRGNEKVYIPTEKEEYYKTGSVYELRKQICLNVFENNKVIEIIVENEECKVDFTKFLISQEVDEYEHYDIYVDNIIKGYDKIREKIAVDFYNKYLKDNIVEGSNICINNKACMNQEGIIHPLYKQAY